MDRQTSQAENDNKDVPNVPLTKQWSITGTKTQKPGFKARSKSREEAQYAQVK
jgi:hypothetical protein